MTLVAVRDCDRLTRSQRRRRFGVQPNVFERLEASMAERHRAVADGSGLNDAAILTPLDRAQSFRR
jgi:hypothetical protein